MAKYLDVALSQIIVKRDERQRKELKNIEELADSIQRVGLLEPLVVDEDLTLIAGERRLAALKLLNKVTAPVVVFSSLSPSQRQLMELEENIRRADLPWQDNCLAVLHAVNLLTAEKTRKKDISTRLGLNPGNLSKMLAVGEALALGKPENLSTFTSWIAAYNTLQRLEDRAMNNELEKLSFIQDSRKPAAEPTTPDKQTVSPEFFVEGGDTIVSPTDISHAIECADFLLWAPLYEGVRFNVIHCDFPYGIDHHKSKQGNVNAYGTMYKDSPEIYWTLLEAFCKNFDHFAAWACHVIFWLNYTHENVHETISYIKQHIPDMEFWPRPLIWHRSDNSGILPDPSRGPRRVYEAALVGVRGDQKIVRATSDVCAWPANKTEALHVSEKPEEMLYHFFQMFVDSSTMVLDPTCGAGSALRAAYRRGAARTLGLDILSENCIAATSAWADMLETENMSEEF